MSMRMQVDIEDLRAAVTALREQLAAMAARLAALEEDRVLHLKKETPRGR